jgi:CheY-like chemotaxis protein
MKKILIAEDDRIFLKLLVSKLKKFGDHFEILTAGDGQEAVEILDKTRVSALVTDIQMPKMDGFELLAYTNANHPVIPCFVMTAHNRPETRQRMPRDLVRFFSKPFEVNDLAEQIIRVLSRDIPKGAVHGISVVSFLRMIELEQKTCLLEVTTPDVSRGLFYFEKGVLFDAVSGDLKGEEAAMAIMAGQQASFTFRQFPDRQVARKVLTPLSDIIAQAVALQEEISEDEWKDIFSEVMD